MIIPSKVLYGFNQFLTQGPFEVTWIQFSPLTHCNWPKTLFIVFIWVKYMETIEMFDNSLSKLSNPWIELLCINSIAIMLDAKCLTSSLMTWFIIESHQSRHIVIRGQFLVFKNVLPLCNCNVYITRKSTLGVFYGVYLFHFPPFFDRCKNSECFLIIHSW